MNKKKVNEKIDFADSTFKSFERNSPYILAITLVSWDEKTIKITFHNFIQFSYKQGDHLSNIYQVFEQSAFLNEALLLDYGKIPENHPFKLFQIEDICGLPFVQVVAESVEIIKT